MQMILNELSYNFPLSSTDDAKNVMHQFLNAYRLLKNLLGDNSVLMNDKYLNNIQLTTDYNTFDWIRDPSVDREEQRMFRILVDKAQIIIAENFGQEDGENSDSEFLLDGQNSIASLIAYETEGVVLSFASCACWMQSKLFGEYSYIDEHGVATESAEVFNVADGNTFEQFESYYRALPQVSCPVHSGKELWDQRDTFFPNLVFCKRTERQLSKDTQSHHVRQIYLKLKELQSYFEKCESSFNPDLIPSKATPESPATLDRFASDHTFPIPDGKQLLFSWHIRFTGNYPGRIFFHPENSKKTGIIGHINGKLPTITCH